MNTESVSESGVRQKAARRLWKLTKFSTRSREYNQYGPYALSNDRNVIVDARLTLERANEILNGMKPVKRGVDYL